MVENKFQQNTTNKAKCIMYTVRQQLWGSSETAHQVVVSLKKIYNMEHHTTDMNSLNTLLSNNANSNDGSVLTGRT